MVQAVSGHGPNAGRVIFNQNDDELYARIVGPSGTPTITPGPMMGTAPDPGSRIVVGTSLRGRLEWKQGTGVTTAHNRLMTVNFPVALPSAPKHVMLRAGNASMSYPQWHLYVTALSVNGFEIWWSNIDAPLASLAVGVLIYEVVL